MRQRRSAVKRLSAIVAAGVALCVVPAAAHAATVVVGAAGDIACDPADANFKSGNGTATLCRQKYTSDILVDSTYSAVLPLGDLQYNSGSLSNFNASYDKSWGRLWSKSYPAIGNHEGTSATGGKGYCSYWKRGAEDRAHCNSSGAQGNAAYYSYNVGDWHVVVLNSNCTAAGGCTGTSPQYQWLVRDLDNAANQRTCTLAYWHHPRFSSGHDHDNTFMQPIWQLLYDKGADLVLAGHSHDYERFKALNGSGVPETTGMRSFVVGTGGAFFTGLGSRGPNSEAGQNTTYGILKLTLSPSSYSWNYINEVGSKVFNDNGSQNCRGPVVGGTPDGTAPTAPTLSAGTPTATTVPLSWSGAQDNVGVTGYQVFRVTGTGAPVQVGTPTGTSFTDTGLSPATSYTYTVKAVDAAGNVSPASNAVPVTTAAAGTGGATPLTFFPDADATIDQSAPTVNAGTNGRIVVDQSPVNDFLVKFTVAGCTTGVSNAKLRLTVGSTANDNSPKGGQFQLAANSSWDEATVNWNTAPAVAANSPVASIPTAVALNTTYLVDVTPFVSGNGTLTIRASGLSSDGARYYSRDGNADTVRPQLQVTCT